MVHPFMFSQLLFRGFGRGSGSGIIRSGARTHSGMDSIRAFSLVPGPSTRSMRGEDSSNTLMLCTERIRLTSSSGLDPSPRYRKMNRLIRIPFIREGPFLRTLAQSQEIFLPEAEPVPWHLNGPDHAAYSEYSDDRASKAFWPQSLSLQGRP